MDFFNLPFWQSVVSNLLATAIGAALGIFGALWLSNYLEKRTGKERKKKILDVLLDELKENFVFLESKKDKNFDFSNIKNSRDYVVDIGVSLYTESWDAFSNGGELEWIDDPVFLGMLATSYNKIDAIKYLANKYFDLAYSDNRFVDQETLEFIGKRLKEKVNTGFLHIDETLKCIEAEIKKIQ